MQKDKILDIFYNHIIPEASKGCVDCYFLYNIIFNTRVLDKNIELMTTNNNSKISVPTLYIRDCKKFEQLLVEYVEKALEFYDNSNFEDEVLMCEYEGVCKEKVIMTLLWSNATVEDFHDPCSFLRKRIDYFELGDLKEYKYPQIVGYSEILGTDIECCINKARIESETPYYLQIFLLNPDDGKRIYEFPRIYFGVSEGIANIYAIQNAKDRLVDERYNKKIDRKMYKVNEGLDVNEDTYDNYGIGNLKDVTSNFVVAANVLIGLLKSHNIQKINVVSILISRWNAKMLMLDFKKGFYKRKDYSTEAINKLINEHFEKTKSIQINLTDKFLRVFRRLGYHHSSVGIVGYPMDFDSNLSIFLYDQEDICNNRLLEDTFIFSKNLSQKK